MQLFKIKWQEIYPIDLEDFMVIIKITLRDVMLAQVLAVSLSVTCQYVQSKHLNWSDIVLPV